MHVLFHFLFSDEDECSDPSKCLHGVCQNYRGGYQCLCDPGFVVTENMKDCVGQYHDTFLFYHGMKCYLRHSTSLPSERDKRMVTTCQRDYKGNKSRRRGNACETSTQIESLRLNLSNVAYKCFVSHCTRSVLNRL